MSNSARKVLLGLVALALVAMAARMIWRSTEGSAVPASTSRVMDSRTGEVFELPVDKLTGGYPYKNPRTGEQTLYPVEVCYANECGRQGGTPVIMNELLGKTGSTFCPKCGTLVQFHNPGPPREGPPAD